MWRSPPPRRVRVTFASRFAFPATDLPREGLAESRVSFDLVHVNVGDFAGLGIAREEPWHAGIGFHDPQQHIGGGWRREGQIVQQ